MNNSDIRLYSSEEMDDDDVVPETPEMKKVKPKALPNPKVKLPTTATSASSKALAASAASARLDKGKGKALVQPQPPSTGKQLEVKKSKEVEEEEDDDIMELPVVKMERKVSSAGTATKASSNISVKGSGSVSAPNPKRKLTFGGAEQQQLLGNKQRRLDTVYEEEENDNSSLMDDKMWSGSLMLDFQKQIEMRTKEKNKRIVKTFQAVQGPAKCEKLCESQSTEWRENAKKYDEKMAQFEQVLANIRQRQEKNTGIFLKMIKSTVKSVRSMESGVEKLKSKVKKTAEEMEETFNALEDKQMRQVKHAVEKVYEDVLHLKDSVQEEENQGHHEAVTSITTAMNYILDAANI